MAEFFVDVPGVAKDHKHLKKLINCCEKLQAALCNVIREIAGSRLAVNSRGASLRRRPHGNDLLSEKLFLHNAEGLLWVELAERKAMAMDSMERPRATLPCRVCCGAYRS
jgi:hypothetical protein